MSVDRLPLPNAAYRRIMNPKGVTYQHTRPLVFADSFGLQIGQSGVSVLLPFGQNPVPPSIGGVLFGIAVSQIAQRIVKVISIVVQDKAFIFGRQPNERLGHQPMDFARKSAALFAKSDLQASCRINGLLNNLPSHRAWARHRSLHNAGVGHRISGKRRYRSPSGRSMSAVSHVEHLMFGCGQGGAAVSTLTSPASGSTPKRQRKEMTNYAIAFQDALASGEWA